MASSILPTTRLETLASRTFELNLLVMSGHTFGNDNILNLSLSHGPVLLFISFWICILCSECEARGEM